VKAEHRYLQPAVLERVQNLRPLADEAGLSMAAFAVAWVLQNRNVSAAIVGASRPEQLKDNVAASGIALDADLLRKVDEVLGDVVERDPGKVESFLARP
jgi:aryl-alcohol dehydrogenase-like predicted oxidoreductase